MKPYALIPAKGHSERLPDKNSRLLGGRTLVQHAIDAAKSSGLFDKRIAVSSENTAILALAAGESVYPLRRPPEYSTPEIVLSNVIEHAAEALEWSEPFYVLLPSSPFRNPDTMRDAWDVYTHENVGALLSIAPYEHPPYWAMLLDRTNNRLTPMDENCFRMPRSELPVAWRHDGAHHIIRSGVSGVMGFPVRWEESVDINTEEELLFAEFLLASRRVPWVSAVFGHAPQPKVWRTRPG